MSNDRLDGWTAIADYVGKAEKTCKRLASMDRPEDERMPVFRMLGVVCALKSALDAWQKRLAAKGLHAFNSAVNSGTIG